MAAGDAIVGTLRAVLGLDTGQFEDGAKRASAALDTFGKKVFAIAAGVGLERGLEKVVETFVRAVVNGFERIDKAGKDAQKTGLAVEQFTALSVAAALSDVSIETLATSLGKLSKAMVDTAKGTGETKNVFESLGITVTNTDGTLKSANVVLEEISDRFAETGDSATKTAAAIALFGRGGKELIPLLNEGGKSLREWADTAQRMGLVISSNTAASVQRFNDNLKILQLAQQGVINLVIEGLIPAFVRVSDTFAESAKTGDSVRSAAESIIRAFKELVVVAFQVAAADKILGEGLKAIQELLTNTSILDSGKQLEKIGEIFGSLADALAAAREEAGRWFTAITVGSRNIQGDIDVGATKFKDTIADLTLKMRENIGEFNNLASGLPALAVKLDLTDKAAQSLSLSVSGLTEQQRQLNDALLQFNASKLVEQTIDPITQLQEKIAGLNLLITNGRIGFDQYFVALNLGIASALQRIGGSLSFIQGGFAELGKTSKQFAIAAKAVSIAMALINTYEAATKALTAAPPPFNYALAAATVVAGLGYVAKASATQFATGGSFKIGGGMGGIDSQLITFKGTPGEMVDIRRPGQERAAAVQEINLTGIRSRDMFTGDMLRELFDSLNAGMADGYKLKVAT